MPLYEYRCRDCDVEFEALVAARGGDDIHCPGCDGRKLDRLLGLPAPVRGAETPAAANCGGTGPPCGRAGCGRRTG